MRLRILTLVVCLAFPLPGISAGQELSEDRAAALTAIRQAAAARDLESLETSLAAAAKLRGDFKYDAELDRLDVLAEYVAKFWQTVERACTTLQAPTELMVGESSVRFVEYTKGRLTLRLPGKNETYTRKDMPPLLALALAKQVLVADAAQNKVFYGAFFALDKAHDRKLARQFWEEAGAGGNDVARLLPELDVPPPPRAVDIPAMNPILRNLLSEKNWSLRKQTEKGWIRHPLDEIGKQNDEGRLEVHIPADAEGPMQLVAKRQISGDFVCRLIVQNSDKMNAIGLVAAGIEDEGFTTSLPNGTTLIELSRKQGTLSCKLSGADVELTPTGKPAARLAGFIGLQLAPGSEVVVAAVEFAVR